MSEPEKARFESAQLGKYRLLALLATGGMAEVFLAKTISVAGFEKLVVIKRILPNLAREERFVNMFLDEAKLAASLNHPNVIQIFELGQIGDRYFMAMEYLFGENASYVLRGATKAGRAIPEEICAGIILQAAQGLHHAHTLCDLSGKPLAIVHRDVSPQNIFVLYDGAVKVVDFGIAKAATSSQKTQTGTLKGKFAYMSPEQITGSNLDARSDVFSLGIVFWELLCGRKLFKHEKEFEILKAIVEQDAPPAKTLRPDISPVLEQIIAKALCRDRERRYQSAGELQEDLRAFLQSGGRAGDSVAIAAFMKELFGDRIKQKQQFLQQAQQQNKALEEALFGDLLRDMISDTEYSVPRTTPSRLASGKKAKNRFVFLPIALLVCLLSLAGFFVFRKVQLPAKPVANERPLAITEENKPTQITEPKTTTNANPDQKQQVETNPLQKENQSQQPPPAPVDAKKVSVRSNPNEKKASRPQVSRPENKPKATGFLRLTTQPWTEVWHGGRKLGQTPLLDVELPAGSLQLRLVNREAKIDKTIKLEIEAGQTIRKKIELE